MVLEDLHTRTRNLCKCKVMFCSVHTRSTFPGTTRTGSSVGSVYARAAIAGAKSTGYLYAVLKIPECGFGYGDNSRVPTYPELL